MLHCPQVDVHTRTLGYEVWPQLHCRKHLGQYPTDMPSLDTWRLVYPKPDMQQLVCHSDQLDERLKQWMGTNMLRQTRSFLKLARNDQMRNHKKWMQPFTATDQR